MARLLPVVFALLISAPAEACPREQPFESPSTYCAVATDDTANPPSYTPWAHKPLCLDGRHKADKLCVYTSPAFNEHTGLSLVTTPEIAASVASTVQQHSVTRRYAHHLLASKSRNAAANLSYEIRDMPGRGKGVVAIRNLARFEVIMVGFPALIVHRDMLPPLRQGAYGQGAMSTEERARLFQNALEQLPDQERVLGLARSMRVDGMHVAEDAVRTNAFGVSINKKGLRGLYPEVAVSLGVLTLNNPLSC